jgi:Mn-dependent DtxR family transcriptional regulator
MDPETSAFKIIFFLTFKDTPMQPSEISRNLGEKGSTVRARLSELKQDGLVESTPDGYISVFNIYEVIMKLYRCIKENIGDE